MAVNGIDGHHLPCLLFLILVCSLDGFAKGNCIELYGVLLYRQLLELLKGLYLYFYCLCFHRELNLTNNHKTYLMCTWVKTCSVDRFLEKFLNPEQKKCKQQP